MFNAKANYWTWLTAVTVLAAVGCRERASTENSSLSMSGSGHEVETAYELLTQVKEIGDCQIAIERLPPASMQTQSRLKLHFSNESSASDDYTVEKIFSNQESNRSLIDIKHAWLGVGAPYALVLERVDVSTAPAYKYRFEFAIENQRLTDLKLTVFYGMHSNIVRQINCKT